MLTIDKISKEDFKNTWDEILSIMQSMESDKAALKQLKAELGTVIGAENAKETNELIKALLRKQKESEFYDSEAVANAQEVWETFIDDWKTPREE